MTKSKWEKSGKRKIAARLLAGCMTAVIAAMMPICNETEVQAENIEDYCLDVNTISLDMKGKAAASTGIYFSYASSQPNVDNFIDYQGHLNASYLYKNKVYIKRLDCHYQEIDEIELAPAMEVFGAVTCDSDGNYYVVSAVSRLLDGAYSDNVMAITKYDYHGVKLLEKYYPASSTYHIYFNSDKEASPNTSLTRIPFSAGNCDLAVNSAGVLACNYGRGMFNGHQSNFIFYADTNTLELKNRGEVPYTSHAFNQRILALPDNTFFSINQGDAYPRAFEAAISGESNGRFQSMGEYGAFHFREGANRSSGYNETFAQMGSAVPVEGGAAFCAASEKTLSRAAAPSTEYCGHNEARDVFVQIYQIRDGEFSTVGGITRKAEDAPAGNELTNLWLHGDEEDPGVIWLTDYDDDFFAANCRMVKAGNHLFILWEKTAYAQSEYKGTYYAVLDTKGNILKGETQLADVLLPENYDVVTDGNHIFFAATDGTDKMTICVMTIQTAADRYADGTATGHHIVTIPETAATCSQTGLTKGQYCEECGKVVLAQETLEKTGHQSVVTIDAKATAEKDGAVVEKCSVCGKELQKTRIPHPAKIVMPSYNKYTYDGDTQEPHITVQDSDGNTIDDEHYSVRYIHNINVGTATVIAAVTGDKYDAVLKETFVIRPESTYISGYTASDRKIIVRYSKREEQVTGYQIRFREKGGSWKVNTIKNNQTTSRKYEKLKSGTNYQVQVRTYKKVQGQNYYSDWSTIRTIKTS